ncbi:MAG TPA: hypothetical protein VLM89_07300, partial [Phycisphaerae bacterium]|nr:hypothetical protein [Phycisphaerae bacterium]
MIVPMAKVFVACRSRDRRKLLDALGEMGVIHLKPVDPERAAPDEKSLADIRDIERAVQILAGIQPAEPVADLPAIEAAREVLALQQRAAERQNRLVALDFQLRQIAVWGDVRLEQFEQLRSAGIDVKFYSVPIRDLGQVDAELVQPLAPLPGKRMLIGVVDRQDTARLPESAEQSPLPQRDAPSLRTEAAELDAQGKQDVRRLTQLAHLTDEMEKAARLLRRKVQYDVALRGA